MLLAMLHIYINLKRDKVCVSLRAEIQDDQKVSVHLTVTVHHQVHRDFLITLYFYSYCQLTLFLVTNRPLYIVPLTKPPGFCLNFLASCINTEYVFNSIYPSIYPPARA